MRKRYIAEYFRFKGISLMRNNNLDSSKLNFKKSIATFLKADDTLNAIRTLSNLASCYNKAGDIQLAKKTYYEVLKFTGRSKKKNFLVSNQIVKYNLGVFYSKQGKNDSAINYLNKSLKIGKQLENNEMIGESLYMLATIHSSLVQGEKVDSLFKESLFYSKQTGNNTYISAIYNNWAKHLVKRKSNKQGLLLYKTGLFYAKLSKDFDLISNLYGNIGNTSFTMGNNEEAMLYIDSGLHLAKEKKLLFTKSRLLRYRARVNDKSRNYNAVLDDLLLAESISIRFNRKKDLLSLYKNLASVYNKKEDYFHSLNYLNRYCLLKDSFYSIENSQSIISFKAKYQTEKAEKKNLILKLENKQIENQKLKESRNKYLWMSISGLLLAIIYFLFQWLTKKKKMEVLKQQKKLQMKEKEILLMEKEVYEKEKEKQLYMDKMQKSLHDGVCSDLHGVSMKLDCFIEKRNNGTEFAISSLLKVIGKIRSLSHSIKNSIIPEKINLQEDLNMFLELHKREGLQINFDYDEEVESRLSLDKKVNLLAIVKELITNSNKHALNLKKIGLSILRKEEFVEIKVEDDGEISDVINISGVGLLNIEERISDINGKWIKKSLDKGAKYEMLIPI